MAHKRKQRKHTPTPRALGLLAGAGALLLAAPVSAGVASPDALWIGSPELQLGNSPAWEQSLDWQAQVAARGAAPGLACYGPASVLHMGEGGEGGESGGEKGPRGLASVFANTTVPQEFAACVAMVQAHLAAARVLLAANNPGDASLNFRAAADRYAGMDALLAARRLDPVQDTLKELADKAAHGGTLTQLSGEMDEVNKELQQALGTLPAGVQTQPEFALSVALALWKQMAARYPAAIDGDQMASEAIYQEAWALAQGAAAWVQRTDAALQKSHASYTKLQDTMTRLAAALPQAPPDKLLAPPDLYTLQLRLELRVRQLVTLP